MVMTNAEKCKNYRNKHLEERREKERSYYHRNKEVRLNAVKKYYQENKEKCKARGKVWVENNREKWLQDKKDWATKNPTRTRHIKRAWCARKKLYDEGMTVGLVQRVFEDNIKKHGRLTCILCKKPIIFGDDSLEHIIPLSRGGTNEYGNLGVSHLNCNFKKHNKIIKI